MNLFLFSPFICALFLFSANAVHGAVSLNLFDVDQDALSVTNYFNGQFISQERNAWSGSYDLGSTGTVSGSSSLPDPGRESSGSGAFMADHTFGPVTWELSGLAQGSIDAGLGNAGSVNPTIANATIVSTVLSFYMDSPFTITLTGMVLSQFSGNGSDPGQSGATVRLFAEIVDGVIVNNYLADWSTFQGDTGGSYTGSFSSGVFRLEVQSTALLSSNIQDEFMNQYSSYDAVMSVQPVPEPSSVVFLGAAGLLMLRRRRKRSPQI